MKDNTSCIMDVDEACKEAGISRHVVRFTSSLHIKDSGPSSSTAHKLYTFLIGELPLHSVTFSDGEISVESVLVKVEGR